MIPTSKVLLVCDPQATSPVWALTREAQDLRVILEPSLVNATTRWAEKGPDLIVFDVNPPESPSLDEVRKLRQAAILPVLMLISSRSEPFMLEAYAAGVDECILKPVSPALLHAKIKAWLRHSWSLPADLLEALTVGGVTLSPSDRSIILRQGQPIPLTNLELRLLYYLMSRPGHTAKIEELCDRVWGYGGGGDPATLKNVVYRLRRKIEPDPTNPDYLQTVAGVGYRIYLPG